MSVAPQVGVVMGSDSDLKVMDPAAAVLTELGIEHEMRVVSAHRTPHDMLAYATGAADRGLKVIIAGAGGAAHLPGMVASATTLPVIGVPVPLANLDGLDALLSIVQMPAGIPWRRWRSAAPATPAYSPHASSLSQTHSWRERSEEPSLELAEQAREKDARLQARLQPNT